MGNLRNRVDARLVPDAKNMKSQYVNYVLFHERCLAKIQFQFTKLMRLKVQMRNKPGYASMCILDLSKTLSTISIIIT